MGEVRALPNGKLPTKQILEYALREDFKEVIVVGIRKRIGDDGEKLWVSASEAEAARVVWLLGVAEGFVSRAMEDVEL